VRCCAILGVLAGLAHGCTDPGCIRNSECQTNYRCLEQVCTRSAGDAGTTPTPTTPRDATIPERPDTSTPIEPDPIEDDDAGE
jgi:hypothetical protein